MVNKLGEQTITQEFESVCSVFMVLCQTFVDIFLFMSSSIVAEISKI